MLRASVTLQGRQRATVRRAIRETCRLRNWALHAVNIRTNHIHAVVGIIDTSASTVLNALKASSTRALRERGLWQSDKSPWNDKGSVRYLWTEKSVLAACNYTLHEQGEDLPDF
jgi:REP element-mobilizing transposase RayT